MFFLDSLVPSWFEILFQLASLIVGLFLLVLAGLAFTRISRRPRESWLFLAAIGLSLGQSWGLHMILRIFYHFGPSNLPAEWLGLTLFFADSIAVLIWLVLEGLAWGCLMFSIFGSLSLVPEPEDTLETSA